MPPEWANTLEKRAITADTTSYPAILVAEFLAILGFAASGPLLPSFLQELGIADGAPIKLWSGLASSLPAAALAFFAPIPELAPVGVDQAFGDVQPEPQTLALFRIRAPKA